MGRVRRLRRAVLHPNLGSIDGSNDHYLITEASNSRFKEYAAFMHRGSMAGTVTERVAALDPGIAVQVERTNGTDWFAQPKYDTVTGSGGHYTVANLPAGQYRLRFVDATGQYVNTYYGGAVASDTATTIFVADGQDVDGGAQVLPVANTSVATFRGRVTDETGAPLAGVSVGIFSLGDPGGVEVLTDQNGVYRYTSPLPGYSGPASSHRRRACGCRHPCSSPRSSSAPRSSTTSSCSRRVR